MGRIQPGQEISSDGETWQPAVEAAFLDMRWSIDIGDGTPRGPFNKCAAEALLRSGRLPPGSRIVEVEAAFRNGGDGCGNEESPIEEPEVAETSECPVSESSAHEECREPEIRVVEKIVEVPVEKIGEKEIVKEIVKEVPVERIVEKEVIKEVPVERVVEKERIVEVESAALLAKAAALEAAVTAAREEGAKALSAERAEIQKTKRELEEAKRETLTLESEIKRLPSNAKEAADTEAAVYGLLRAEADDLERILAEEKKEAETAQNRWRERFERLTARRIDILKKIGNDAKDMKQRALRLNPVDPRTAQVRQELEALRIVAERNAHESTIRIKELTRSLNEKTIEVKRLSAQVDDVKRLQEQIRQLRDMLHERDRELQDERRKVEYVRQNCAASQQVLLARLSELESGMPGRTNQSREAHAQASRFPSWMGFKK
jgi:chromosome segregation ATPase